VEELEIMGSLATECPPQDYTYCLLFKGGHFTTAVTGSMFSTN
jgi:hypothetical protein